MNNHISHIKDLILHYFEEDLKKEITPKTQGIFIRNTIKNFREAIDEYFGYLLITGETDFILNLDERFKNDPKNVALAHYVNLCFAISPCKNMVSAIEFAGAGDTDVVVHVSSEPGAERVSQSS